MIEVRKRRACAQGGFALLEVLVATAIAAISLAIIYGMIASSSRAARSEQATIEASMLARSLLAEVTGGAKSEPGEYWSDQRTEPRWRLRLTPEGDVPELPKSGRVLKVELTIWHMGGDRAPLEFTTQLFVHD